MVSFPVAFSYFHVQTSIDTVHTLLNHVQTLTYAFFRKCYRKADYLPEPFLGGIYTAWKCMYRWANSCTIALLITIRKAVQARMHLTCIKCVVLMYNVCTCLYNVCRMYIHVHDVLYLYVHGTYKFMKFNICMDTIQTRLYKFTTTLALHFPSCLIRETRKPVETTG